MKPFRIFIFFLVVLLLLLLVALLFPEQGIDLGGNLRLSFMPFPGHSEADTTYTADTKDTTDTSVDIEQLLAGSTVTSDPESEPPEEPVRDSGTSEERIRPAVIPANVDSLKQNTQRIKFAPGNVTLLHPFFDKLNGMMEGNGQQTRILHFGDSQIENDRMSALIRYRLQRNFGGTGTGLVQAIPLYSGSLSYQQEESSGWLRYTYFGKRDSTISHDSYGIMGAFASVPLPVDDRWPMLFYRFNTDRRSGQIEQIRLFLHSYVDSASVVFFVNELQADTLRGIPDGFSVANLFYDGEIRDVRISFNLPEGGRIYGISFESKEGVQVDNIAMRGESGLIFTKMNRASQQAMLDNLSPGLILLQYGGNVVPYMSPGYYRRNFKQQLQFFMELCPGIPIIVIGPADMSMRQNGRFTSYPGVEAIRDALRAATLESGFAFWDLYQAMGGKNSMPSFVQADPPLASTDFIHFNKLGINLVAEMFYNALMLEYNEYEIQNQDR